MHEDIWRISRVDKLKAERLFEESKSVALLWNVVVAISTCAAYNISWWSVSIAMCTKEFIHCKSGTVFQRLAELKLNCLEQIIVRADRNLSWYCADRSTKQAFSNRVNFAMTIKFLGILVQKCDFIRVVSTWWNRRWIRSIWFVQSQNFGLESL
mgnify:CR=1 FL=1